MVPPAFARAQDAFEAGDTALAQRELDAALAADPDCAWCHYLSGQLLLRRGDEAGAEREYRRTVALDAKTSAHHDLGDLALRHGNLEAARAEYRLDLQSHPECYEARINLAALELRAGHRAEAARQYELSLTYHPDDARAHQALRDLRIHQALPFALAFALCCLAFLLFWRRAKSQS